jgi:hypothetical protein
MDLCDNLQVTLQIHHSNRIMASQQILLLIRKVVMSQKPIVFGVHVHPNQAWQ